ncbi:MAG TPA: hypothetical protein VGF42_02005 [Caulobacteraceae bacterium]|jgi:hypothetical protein
MTSLSVEKRRQVMQSRAAFWQALREAVAADLATSPAGGRAHQSGAASPERTA